MQAKFVEGNILQHVTVMAFSGTVGLLALFLVDLADTFFLSLLDDVAILAALGYSASILFFTVSLCIGLSIGCGAMVAKLAGGDAHLRSRRFVSHTFLLIALLSSLTAALIFAVHPYLLTLLGADGDAYTYAYSYIRIILPSLPLLALAMASGGIMRAYGEARLAMYLPMVGAAVNALLDPLFIFTFGWGMEGAAAASVIARMAMCCYGFWIVIHHHNLLGAILPSHIWEDAKDFFNVALPAVLTNLSTPIGVAFITAFMAQFGNEAVGGNAIVARIQQVSFAGLFALSGAIGPIAAQNWGAGNIDRVDQTFSRSLLFVLVYCMAVCAALALACPWLIKAFQAEGTAADLIRWTCYGFSLVFLFNGATFVTNALFNNLGVAKWATYFNFGKATLGTLPFAYLGALWAGPFGIYFGVLVGAALTAAFGVMAARWHIRHLSITAKAAA